MAAVNKETKKLIETTIDEVFSKMNKISWIERQKALKEEAFKNTEKLLYSYEALKEHLANEDEYIDMAFHGKSKSITSYTKNSFTTQTDDEIMAARLDSYYRSKSDVEKIENALEAVRNKKGFPIIEMRYFTTTEDDITYTWAEIAEKLAGTNGFSDRLDERTVRNYKNKLVREISVLIFGSDAI